MIRLLALLLVATLATNASADDEFSSDRPGYANGTSAAPVLRPITELGGTLSWDPDLDTTGTFPDLRIRVGAARWLEFRVDAPTVLFADPVGLGDMTFAIKLASPVARTLAVSVIPSVTVPVGTGGGITTGRLELNWSASAGIVGFGGNFAVGAVAVMDERRVRGEGSFALSLQPLATFAIYVQSYVLWTDGEDPLPHVGAGTYIKVHPRVQIDAYVDVGVTDDTTRLLVGAGTSVLWGTSGG